MDVGTRVKTKQFGAGTVCESETVEGEATGRYFVMLDDPVKWACSKLGCVPCFYPDELEALDEK